MVGKRCNVLREYHLLIVRGPEGFSWQIRYGRHANTAEQSERRFLTHAEAAAEGEQALNKHRSAAQNSI